MIKILLLAFTFLLPLAFNLKNTDSPFELFKFLFSGVAICSISVVFFAGKLWSGAKEIKLSKAWLVLLIIAFANAWQYLHHRYGTPRQPPGVKHWWCQFDVEKNSVYSLYFHHIPAIQFDQWMHGKRPTWLSR